MLGGSPPRNYKCIHNQLKNQLKLGSPKKSLGRPTDMWLSVSLHIRAAPRSQSAFEATGEEDVECAGEGSG